MKRKDCEICRKHRARWVVELKDNISGSRKTLKICGICKWKYWPSPRRDKDLVIVRVVSRFRSRVRK